MSKRVLRGIAWDHDRGHTCLVRTAPQFMMEHPGIEVLWEKRSLRDFGQAPIDVLADRYDLVIFDHPFVGKAAASGCLIDLRPHLDAGEISALLADSVGKSSESYHYDGGIFGLPTDAAAQVAAYRPDLLAGLGAEVPRTHDEVLRLARRARQQDKTISTPACPIDAACLIFTFAANLAAPLDTEGDRFIEPAMLDEVLGRIEELIRVSHPRSLDWNPIQSYDTMVATDDVVYSSYAFGYSNYSRKGRQPILLATNIAGPGSDPARGSLLGGAGLGVTHSCKDVEAAITYARWLHRPEFQAGAYFAEGGQPGLRSAWLSERVNAASNGFFQDTLETLDKAYLRPRWNGFLPFFEETGELANHWLRGALSRKELADRLTQNFERSRSGALTRTPA